MYHRPFAPFLAAAVLLPVLPAQEPIDQEAIAFFRSEGLERSQVMDHLSWMCDVYGPRLTGSANLRAAQRWAVERFAAFGLAKAHVERWGPFGRGWRCERTVVEVVGDNPWPVLAYPKAWSPSLAGRVEAEVVWVAGLDAEELERLDLSGKVVLLEEVRTIEEPFAGISRRLDAEDLLALADQRSAAGQSRERRAAAAADATDFRRGFQLREARMRVLARKRPLAILDRAGKGDYGTVFVSGASAVPVEGRRASARDPDAEVIPQFTVAVEHYNRICRLLQKGLPVRLALELRTSFTAGDVDDYNVLADIPGTDEALGGELVMIGAHFDSWHAGTGCTDNGCGSAVVMEAARLVQAFVRQSGKGPRRTIRAALWSGEEQGLLGSRAYVREHFGAPGSPTAAHAAFAGYFNLDNGTGRIRGVHLQENEACAPIFRAWLRPFHDLGASTLTPNNTGGTDHLAFDGVGLPGFQFIQDPVSYDSRTHHSNMDVYDHAVPADLQQAATIMAAFAWHAAQRDEKLPRKPFTPRPERDR